MAKAQGLAGLYEYDFGTLTQMRAHPPCSQAFTEPPVRRNLTQAHEPWIWGNKFPQGEQPVMGQQMGLMSGARVCFTRNKKWDRNWMPLLLFFACYLEIK